MKHFDKYVSLIDSGHIVVGKYVAAAIERVKRYKQQYIFKQEEADKRISFIENETSNTKGSNDKLQLALPQKVWLEVAWGFYVNALITKTDTETLEEYQVREERRLIHEVAILMSRGMGKTTLGAAIAEVGQIIDGEYGADIQLLAYDRTQAGFLYNASRAMTSRKDSILHSLVENGVLTSTKQGMLYTPTNSLMTIKTSDYDSLDGTNAHYNMFDEVHAYDEDFIKIVNDGSRAKRKNWMTWYLTTNGTKRDKVFDKYFNYWKDIVTGKVENDSIFPWIYQLDDAKEIHQPEMWQKAMPMLGITTSKEDVQANIDDSKNDPSKQAELMAKTFNLPVNNYLSYFTNEEVKGNSEEFDKNSFIGNDYRNAKAILGVDLSAVNDLTSISFMTVKGDKYYFKNRVYVPRHTFERLPKDHRDNYERWEEQGHLIIHDKDFNEPEFLFDDLLSFMKENFILPITIGYDPWGGSGKTKPELIQAFDSYYGEISHVIPQKVPVLSQPMKLYKALIGAKKIIFDDPVASWNHANVQVKIDGNGNVFPNKAKAKDKIDIFASQLDAFIAYQHQKDELQYYFNE